MDNHYDEEQDDSHLTTDCNNVKKKEASSLDAGGEGYKEGQEQSDEAEQYGEEEYGDEYGEDYYGEEAN